MKTITICGSMRFAEEMRRIAWELETRHGMNVLQCVYDPPGAELSQPVLNALEAAHYSKIDLSDGIYVVDIGGYVGESVRQEIHYAQKKGKWVLYHSEFSKNKIAPDDQLKIVRGLQLVVQIGTVGSEKGFCFLVGGAIKNHKSIIRNFHHDGFLVAGNDAQGVAAPGVIFPGSGAIGFVLVAVTNFGAEGRHIDELNV